MSDLNQVGAGQPFEPCTNVIDGGRHERMPLSLVCHSSARAAATEGCSGARWLPPGPGAARQYRVASDGALETVSRGNAVLSNPMLTKCSAFSVEERPALELTDCSPPAIKTLD